MLKNVTLLLIFSISGIIPAFSQYTDDAADKDSDSTGNTNKKPLLGSFKDQGLKGTEFYLLGGNNGLYLELSPFAAYQVAKPLVAGVGVHGSLLNLGSTTYTYYGGHAFARVIIANSFFLHGEYRLLNGLVPGSTTQRKTLGSPIAGFGLMQGRSWFLFGYVWNSDYAEINPLGHVVYRIGFYF